MPVQSPVHPGLVPSGRDLSKHFNCVKGKSIVNTQVLCLLTNLCADRPNKERATEHKGFANPLQHESIALATRVCASRA